MDFIYINESISNECISDGSTLNRELDNSVDLSELSDGQIDFITTIQALEDLDEKYKWVYHKKGNKVVRRKKKIRIRKKRISAKRRNALRKARRKAHTAKAKRNRKRTMKVRKRRMKK